MTDGQRAIRERIMEFEKKFNLADEDVKTAVRSEAGTWAKGVSQDDATAIWREHWNKGPQLSDAYRAAVKALDADPNNRALKTAEKLTGNALNNWASEETVLRRFAQMGRSTDENKPTVDSGKGEVGYDDTPLPFDKRGEGSLPSAEQWALGRALAEIAQAAGIEVITDAQEMARVLMDGDVEMQTRVSALSKAASTIERWIKNGVRDKSFELQLPKVVSDMIRKRLGRDFESHNITANSLAHALKNHGERGKKLTEQSIPLREEDLQLIPYIMTAPDRVKSGNPEGERQSVRFEKQLSNGVVVVVEKEYKNSPNDMETITMWAELSSNALDAAIRTPKHNVQNAIISTDDVAKIQKDAETAIGRELYIEQMTGWHGSPHTFESFDFSHMGSGEGTQAHNRTQFLRTPNGEVYGFVKNGKMYIDPRLINPNTPIHEYTHLWDRALMRANPELWARGKALMKELPLWEEVKNDPAYKDIAGNEDLLASEVHSRLAGNKGARHLDDMVEAAKATGDYVKMAKEVRLKERIKAWLKEAFDWVRDAFGGKWGKKDLASLTVEEFAAMPIKDLAKGVNPAEMVAEATDRINRDRELVAVHNLSEGSLSQACKFKIEVQKNFSSG